MHRQRSSITRRQISRHRYSLPMPSHVKAAFSSCESHRHIRWGCRDCMTCWLRALHQLKWLHIRRQPHDFLSRKESRKLQLEHHRASIGKDHKRFQLTYVNYLTEHWRRICRGTVPPFFFKLLLALVDSQLCPASESRDEVRLILAHVHLLRGQIRNSITSGQISIASGAERRNSHPPSKQDEKL